MARLRRLPGKDRPGDPGCRPRAFLVGAGVTHSRARSSPGSLVAAIFVGGCAGALARAGLAEGIPPADGWPWATFAVNLGGTALLAYFATRLQERLPPSTYRRPFLGTGVCGALTTFSTLQIEAIRLARDGHAALAVTYVVVSVLAGLAAMLVVTKLVRRVRLR